MRKVIDLTKMPEYTFDESYGLPSGINAEIEIVKFNKDYYKIYFDDSTRTDSTLKKPKQLRQGPKWVEQEIISIQEKDKPDATDIFKILAWKAGKIDYKKSIDSKIVFVSNWVIGSCFQMSNQEVVSWNRFLPIANDIAVIWSDYRNNNKKDEAAQNAWESLVELATNTHKNTMKGIGPVILVTLLYFITKAEYPIYDRFAMSSLIAWELDQQGITLPTGTIINGCGLPPKEKPEELKALLKCGKYADYIQLLKSFCLKEYGKEDIWKKERSVDQALYVYGHFYDARY